MPLPLAARNGTGVKGQFYELEPGTQSARAFREAVIELRRHSRFWACVDLCEPGEYEDLRLFLTATGKSGFGIKDGELVSTFSYDSASLAPAITRAGADQGAIRLNCFDTVLPRIYAGQGFVAVARVPFNDDLAPQGWDYGTYRAFNSGRPDVVFMAYHPSIREFPYSPGSGLTCQTWDQAEALQREKAAQWNGR